MNAEVEMPSCVALERYITAFRDFFLIHMPCIHVPTWRPETAHPSLLLVLSAVGANYHGEGEVALQLYRTARLSIIKYVSTERDVSRCPTDAQKIESSASTPEKRPYWVVQSLLFTIAFGAWSGRSDAVQEAIALQATLGHVSQQVILAVVILSVNEEPGCSL